MLRIIDLHFENLHSFRCRALHFRKFEFFEAELLHLNIMIKFFDQIITDVNQNFKNIFFAFELSIVIFAVVAVVVTAASVFENKIDIIHLSIEIQKIPLNSSVDHQNFENLKNLILTINEHVDSKNYVVILYRTKHSKFEIKKKLDCVAIAIANSKNSQNKIVDISTIVSMNVLFQSSQHAKFSSMLGT